MSGRNHLKEGARGSRVQKAAANPIIVALDIDSPQQAVNLAVSLEPHVGGFKVGPRLTHRASPDFVQNLARLGLVFFDHKFMDIPSTTVAAVKAAAEAGATWVSVHALNGPVTLGELRKLEQTMQSINPLFRVVIVTVLTSFEKVSLPPIWSKELDVAESVLCLARSAYEQGLRTFVCSSEEATALRREFGAEVFLIVPGIRPLGSPSQD